jgi:hypothetical protein
MWLPPLWRWPPLLQICLILFSKRKFFSIRILWAQHKSNNKVWWSPRQETERKSVNTFGLPCKQGRSRPSSLQSRYNSLQVHLLFSGTVCHRDRMWGTTKRTISLLLTTADPQASHFLPRDYVSSLRKQKISKPDPQIQLRNRVKEQRRREEPVLQSSQNPRHCARRGERTENQKEKKQNESRKTKNLNDTLG